jgi:putative ABC transport system substrate-binding protein
VLDRRGFLASATLGCAGAAVAQAQPARAVRRIGVLEGGDGASNMANLDAFRRALAELGHVEGRDVVIEYRSSEGRAERLQALARELVRLGVDVLVTNGTPAALSARQVTSTTAIVMASSGEPVAEGLVASAARPGGNVTGLSLVHPDGVGGERLRWLEAAAPGVARVGILWNPTNIYSDPLVKDARRVAPTLGMQLRTFEVHAADQLDHAFEAILLAQVDALMTMTDYVTIAHRVRIVQFAKMSRLPAIYGLREFVEAGGLLGYGADRRDMFRRAATYVHRILGGARPGELAVEPPQRFELVVNLATARTLGLTLPPALLARADAVIE